MKVVIRGVCKGSSISIRRTTEKDLTRQEATLEKLEATLATDQEALGEWDRQGHKVVNISRLQNVKAFLKVIGETFCGDLLLLSSFAGVSSDRAP
ncbi:hypothetical protein NDU88_004116 [Pleurodeles waltl]|uniref:Uncharacterized protein n=1 Tax=Pleurodeles waltl TaxID=8319 RepID=A0AAV7T8E9_PLEWA|nr:hypothetical protein NDU88_004116 [Pleurodeles waltl]